MSGRALRRALWGRAPSGPNLSGLVLCAALLLGGCALPHIYIHDDPLTPKEHLRLGMAYEKDKELENALKEYGRAESAEPLAHLYRGNVLFALERLREAEGEYREAVKLLPDNADALNNLAWTISKRDGSLPEAEAFAARAVALAPNDANFRDTLAAVRRARGEPPSAEPPSAEPPTAKLPAVKPPAVKPPAVKPPGNRPSDAGVQP